MTLTGIAIIVVGVIVLIILLAQAAKDAPERIRTDYDPRRGECFKGNPGLVAALASLRFGAPSSLIRTKGGGWRIEVETFPVALAGEGDTPSAAYARLLDEAEK